MSVTQLNPPIAVNTPKGTGECWFLIDYHPESHLLWVVALDDSGEIWTFPNPDVRAIKNESLGRTLNPDKLKRGRKTKKSNPR